MNATTATLEAEGAAARESASTNLGRIADSLERIEVIIAAAWVEADLPDGRLRLLNDLALDRKAAAIKAILEGDLEDEEA